jgi:hypothetical protein
LASHNVGILVILSGAKDLVAGVNIEGGGEILHFVQDDRAGRTNLWTKPDKLATGRDVQF